MSDVSTQTPLTIHISVDQPSETPLGVITRCADGRLRLNGVNGALIEDLAVAVSKIFHVMHPGEK